MMHAWDVSIGYFEISRDATLKISVSHSGIG